MKLLWHALRDTLSNFEVLTRSSKEKDGWLKLFKEFVGHSIKTFQTKSEEALTVLNM